MNLITKYHDFNHTISTHNNKFLVNLISSAINKAGIGSRGKEEIKSYIIDVILKKYYKYDWYK
jgi:hypothetical protein